MTRANLRDAMPTVAEFIDQCRSAFGSQPVNEAIRAGMQGLSDNFCATENGITVGTAFREPVHFITAVDMVILSNDEIAARKKRSDQEAS